jgi:hypothetical protein
MDDEFISSVKNQTKIFGAEFSVGIGRLGDLVWGALWDNFGDPALWNMMKEEIHENLYFEVFFEYGR